MRAFFVFDRNLNVNRLMVVWQLLADVSSSVLSPVHSGMGLFREAPNKHGLLPFTLTKDIREQAKLL